VGTPGPDVAQIADAIERVLADDELEAEQAGRGPPRAVVGRWRR
jgi:hypothetical protein